MGLVIDSTPPRVAAAHDSGKCQAQIQDSIMQPSHDALRVGLKGWRRTGNRRRGIPEGVSRNNEFASDSAKPGTGAVGHRISGCRCPGDEEQMRYWTGTHKPERMGRAAGRSIYVITRQTSLASLKIPQLSGPCTFSGDDANSCPPTSDRGKWPTRVRIPGQDRSASTDLGAGARQGGKWNITAWGGPHQALGADRRRGREPGRIRSRTTRWPPP